MCLPNDYKTYALVLRKNNTSQAEGSIRDQNAMAFIIFQFTCKWLIESWQMVFSFTPSPSSYLITPL